MIDPARAGLETRIGFIGMGRMGGAMTRRLLGAGYPVTVYDRTASNLRHCLRPCSSAARVT